MLVLFMGATAVGKNTILDICLDRWKLWKSCVRYTTRDIREGEIDGKDYNFISVEEYIKMQKENKFIESEEYSNERFYGTSVDSLKDKKEKSVLCLTITPSGLLNLVMSENDFGPILVVYCKCSLSKQITRYMKRCKNFSVADKLELNDRLARDEGMFKNVETVFKAAEKLYCNKLNFIEINTTDMKLTQTGKNLICDRIKESILKLKGEIKKCN